jgi:hypothetical protein
MMHASLLHAEALSLAALILREAVVSKGVPKPQRDPMERLLNASIEQGGQTLRTLARKAVARLLANPTMAGVRQHGQRLFSDDELLLLAEELATIRTTASLLARSVVAEKGEKARRAGVKESRAETGHLLEGLLTPLVPEEALSFFRSLLPLLGLDPHFLPNQRRTAFHLAVATDTELLSAVQDAIASRIESGEVGSGPAAIDAILDAAGVSAANPQYSDMVFRTNYISSANQGYHDQLKAEIDVMPVWRYSNPSDSRSRPTHAERNGRYYPSTVTIDQIRGADISEVANCRCLPVGIDKWSWADLKAAGARVEPGYVDPTD